MEVARIQSLYCFGSRDYIAGTSKMPKVVKASKAKGKAPAAAASTATAKLYSNFLPIPLLLPSPTPLPSSSSKPITHVKHYIYVRADAKAKSAFSDDNSSEPRTAFAVNLPVDLGERELRALFGRWGVVEHLAISAEYDGGKALEQAVIGGMSDEEDDDEEEEDGDYAYGENQQDGAEEDAAGDRPEPKFMGDNVKPLPRSKRSRKKPALPPSVPEIVPLPPTDPRDTPYGLSGLRTAHITFLDALSLSRCLSFRGGAISLDLTSPSEPTGIEYYLAQHAALRPSLGDVRAFADSSMARFDHLQSMLLSSRARQAGAGALVDEDGFTVVVRGGRYGRAGGRGDGMGKLGVGVAKRGFERTLANKKQAKGASQLPDFYRFQKTDRKKQGTSRIPS